MASDTKKAKLAPVIQVQQAKQIKKDTSGSSLFAGIASARQFLKEVAIEFNKITWPGRTQVIQETYSVLFLVTIITLMVLSFDWVLGKAVFGPLEYWARLHGGGVGRG
jgi:preprotein translocase SecE subunit